MNLKKEVAIFVKTYLPPSEVFIWREINNLKRTNVIILTKRVENPWMFPIKWEIFREPKSGILAWRRFLETILLKDSIDNSYFKEILTRHKTSLIHAHFAWGGMAILELSHKMGLPLITTLRGIDVTRLPRHPVYRHHLRRLFLKGTLFLVQSNDMRQGVIGLGCPPEKILVLPSGVELRELRRRNGEEDPRVLMCGRFVEKKGFELGIEAFCRATKDHKRAQLRIIGDGRLRKRLQKKVKDLKMEENVRFLGFLPNRLVLQEMDEASLLLSPSLTTKDGDKEGMPNVIKEAMAAGLPVISTLHGGIPEIVEDGVSGFLVKERDIEGLSDRLSLLLSDPDMRRRMGQRGREIAYRRLDIHQQVRRLEEIYSSL
jgi:glycosyltransferase involved in cell wall biosynthesis